MAHRLAGLALIPLALAAQQSAGTQSQFVWEGDVDDYCVLKVQQNHVQATDSAGQPIRNEHYRFRSKLPDTNQTLRLQVLHGRGVVRFLSQPRLDNDYTATVRIDDPQPGASHYSIALGWNTSSYDEAHQPRPSKNAGGDPKCCDTGGLSNEQAVAWSGHVDGTVRVSVRGSSSYSQIVAGTLTGEHASVTAALPHRSDLKYIIAKRSGGGEVQVAEQPSEANGYTLTFEIRNGQSTDSEYSVDIGWRAQPASK